MSSTFLDTGFFLALVLEDDSLHKRAIAWQRALGGKLLTTEFVLLEVADALVQPGVREFADALFEMAYGDPIITLVRADPKLVEACYELFRSRMDKRWSLTDCISFNVMRERGITDALTHDHHFEQAGFRALLRHDPPSN